MNMTPTIADAPCLRQPLRYDYGTTFRSSKTRSFVLNKFQAYHSPKTAQIRKTTANLGKDGLGREGYPDGAGRLRPDALSGVPERLAFGGGAKRASVTGSDFDGGRRVFGLPMQAGRVHVRRDRGGVDVNAAGEPVELAVDDQDPDGGDDPGYRANHGRDGSEGFDHDSDVTTVAGVNLAEGPIDALALAALWRMGIERRALGDRPIVGAAGVGGWRLAAVAGWPGPVTLWVQGDMPGYLAALRLEAALMQTGRAVALEVAPAGMDWGDVAYIEAAEREAVQSGD